MITIRDATIADAELITRYSAALAFETEDVKLDEQRLFEGVKALLGDPLKGRYFIAEVDGESAGQTSVTYEWSDWRNGMWWWIQSVYVDAAHRRKGVYKALHDHIVNQAKEAGAFGVRLYVEKENQRAQSAYVNLGMTECHYRMYEMPFR